MLARKPLIFLAVLLTVGWASATQVPRLTLDEVTAGSESVVHGKVARSWPEWNASHTVIWTHTEISVADGLKGAAGSTVVVSEPGGRLDGINMAIAGVLPYAANEEVVLFLYRTPSGYLRTTGMGQGKYTVVTASSGEKRVRGNLAGIELVSPKGQAARAESYDGLTLNEFKAGVRRIIFEQQLKEGR